jgi:hypothetical protein
MKMNRTFLTVRLCDNLHGSRNNTKLSSASIGRLRTGLTPSATDQHIKSPISFVGSKNILHLSNEQMSLVGHNDHDIRINDDLCVVNMRSRYGN